MRQLACALPIFLVATSAYAQNGLPSSKATAAVNTLVKCTMSTATEDDASVQVPQTCVDLYTGAQVVTQGSWIPIASKPLKLSNSQSVFVSPSLISGLYTRTRTKTTTDSTSTAVASGAVYLRTVLERADGTEIVGAPLNLCSQSILGCSYQGNKWGIVLDSRVQSLTQSISECTVLIDGGGSGTCDFTSVIDLILSTASANSFNFIFPNVGQGTYTLKVYAAVGSGATVVGSGTAVGAAAFGLGSVTAEVVRLVHAFDFQ